jgi:hypothetical protein
MRMWSKAKVESWWALEVLAFSMICRRPCSAVGRSYPAPAKLTKHEVIPSSPSSPPLTDSFVCSSR